MSQILEAYQMWLFAAGLSLAMPLTVKALSVFVRKKQPTSVFSATKISEQALKLNQSESKAGKKTNVRFFSGALVAFLLLGMVLILIPIVGILEFSVEERPVGRMAGATVLTSVMVLVAVLYSVKKRDISWLETYRKEGRHE